MRIRRATVDDLDDIADMDRICFPEDEPTLLEPADWWVVVPGPIAYLGAYESTWFPGSLYCHRVGVLPEHRGHGLQRRLIRALVRYAKETGRDAIVTDTTGGTSANNFVAEGFRVLDSGQGWALPHSMYLRRDLRAA